MNKCNEKYQSHNKNYINSEERCFRDEIEEETRIEDAMDTNVKEVFFELSNSRRCLCVNDLSVPKTTDPFLCSKLLYKQPFEEEWCIN